MVSPSSLRVLVILVFFVSPATSFWSKDTGRQWKVGAGGRDEDDGPESVEDLKYRLAAMKKRSKEQAVTSEDKTRFGPPKGSFEEYQLHRELDRQNRWWSARQAEEKVASLLDELEEEEEQRHDDRRSRRKKKSPGATLAEEEEVGKDRSERHAQEVQPDQWSWRKKKEERKKEAETMNEKQDEERKKGAEAEERRWREARLAGDYQDEIRRQSELLADLQLSRAEGAKEPESTSSKEEEKTAENKDGRRVKGKDVNDPDLSQAGVVASVPYNVIGAVVSVVWIVNIIFIAWLLCGRENTMKVPSGFESSAPAAPGRVPSRHRYGLELDFCGDCASSARKYPTSLRAASTTALNRPTRGDSRPDKTAVLAPAPAPITSATFTPGTITPASVSLTPITPATIAPTPATSVSLNPAELDPLYVTPKPVVTLPTTPISVPQASAANTTVAQVSVTSVPTTTTLVVPVQRTPSPVDPMMSPNVSACARSTRNLVRNRVRAPIKDPGFVPVIASTRIHTPVNFQPPLNIATHFLTSSRSRLSSSPGTVRTNRFHPNLPSSIKPPLQSSSDLGYHTSDFNLSRWTPNIYLGSYEQKSFPRNLTRPPSPSHWSYLSNRRLLSEKSGAEARKEPEVKAHAGNGEHVKDNNELMDTKGQLEHVTEVAELKDDQSLHEQKNQESPPEIAESQPDSNVASRKRKPKDRCTKRTPVQEGADPPSTFSWQVYDINDLISIPTHILEAMTCPQTEDCDHDHSRYRTVGHKIYVSSKTKSTDKDDKNGNGSLLDTACDIFERNELESSGKTNPRKMTGSKMECVGRISNEKRRAVTRRNERDSKSVALSPILEVGNSFSAATLPISNNEFDTEAPQAPVQATVAKAAPTTKNDLVIKKLEECDNKRCLAGEDDLKDVGQIVSESHFKNSPLCKERGVQSPKIVNVQEISTQVSTLSDSSRYHRIRRKLSVCGPPGAVCPQPTSLHNESRYACTDVATKQVLYKEQRNVSCSEDKTNIAKVSKVDILQSEIHISTSRHVPSRARSHSPESKVQCPVVKSLSPNLQNGLARTPSASRKPRVSSHRMDNLHMIQMKSSSDILRMMAPPPVGYHVRKDFSTSDSSMEGFTAERIGDVDSYPTLSNTELCRVRHKRRASGDESYDASKQLDQRTQHEHFRKIVKASRKRPEISPSLLRLNTGVEKPRKRGSDEREVSNKLMIVGKLNSMRMSPGHKREDSNYRKPRQSHRRFFKAHNMKIKNGDDGKRERHELPPMYCRNDRRSKRLVAYDKNPLVPSSKGSDEMSLPKGANVYYYEPTSLSDSICAGVRHYRNRNRRGCTSKPHRNTNQNASQSKSNCHCNNARDKSISKDSRKSKLLGFPRFTKDQNIWMRGKRTTRTCKYRGVFVPSEFCHLNINTNAGSSLINLSLDNVEARKLTPSVVTSVTSDEQFFSTYGDQSESDPDLSSSMNSLSCLEKTNSTKSKKSEQKEIAPAPQKAPDEPLVTNWEEKKQHIMQACNEGIHKQLQRREKMEEAFSEDTLHVENTDKMLTSQDDIDGCGVAKTGSRNRKKTKRTEALFIKFESSVSKKVTTTAVIKDGRKHSTERPGVGAFVPKSDQRRTLYQGDVPSLATENVEKSLEAATDSPLRHTKIVKCDVGTLETVDPQQEPHVCVPANMNVILGAERELKEQKSPATEIVPKRKSQVEPSKGEYALGEGKEAMVPNTLISEEKDGISKTSAIVSIPRHACPKNKMSAVKVSSGTDIAVVKDTRKAMQATRMQAADAQQTPKIDQSIENRVHDPLTRKSLTGDEQYPQEKTTTEELALKVPSGKLSKKRNATHRHRGKSSEILATGPMDSTSRRQSKSLWKNKLRKEEVTNTEKYSGETAAIDDSVSLSKQNISEVFSSAKKSRSLSPQLKKIKLPSGKEKKCHQLEKANCADTKLASKKINKCTEIDGKEKENRVATPTEENVEREGETEDNFRSESRTRVKKIIRKPSKSMSPTGNRHFSQPVQSMSHGSHVFEHATDKVTSVQVNEEEEIEGIHASSDDGLTTESQKHSTKHVARRKKCRTIKSTGNLKLSETNIQENESAQSSPSNNGTAYKTPTKPVNKHTLKKKKSDYKDAELGWNNSLSSTENKTSPEQVKQIRKRSKLKYHIKKAPKQQSNKKHCSGVDNAADAKEESYNSVENTSVGDNREEPIPPDPKVYEHHVETSEFQPEALDKRMESIGEGKTVQFSESVESLDTSVHLSESAENDLGTQPILDTALQENQENRLAGDHGASECLAKENEPMPPPSLPQEPAIKRKLPVWIRSKNSDEKKRVTAKEDKHNLNLDTTGKEVALLQDNPPKSFGHQHSSYRQVHTSQKQVKVDNNAKITYGFLASPLSSTSRNIISRFGSPVDIKEIIEGSSVDAPEYMTALRKCQEGPHGTAKSTISGKRVKFSHAHSKKGLSRTAVAKLHESGSKHPALPHNHSDDYFRNVEQYEMMLRMGSGYTMSSQFSPSSDLVEAVGLKPKLSAQRRALDHKRSTRKEGKHGKRAGSRSKSGGHPKDAPESECPEHLNADGMEFGVLNMSLSWVAQGLLRRLPMFHSSDYNNAAPAQTSPTPAAE